jgi:hypothetical protein
VYWDSTYLDVTRFGEHEAVRDYLASRGYEVVDDAALAELMTARVSNGAPSVVVFAMDRVP